MRLCRKSRFPRAAQVGAIVLLLMADSAAQETTPKNAAYQGNVSASLTDLQSEVHELKDLVQQLKQETTASRAEITLCAAQVKRTASAQSLQKSAMMAPRPHASRPSSWRALFEARSEEDCANFLKIARGNA